MPPHRDADELHDAKRDEDDCDNEHRDTKTRQHAMSPGLLEGEKVGVVAIVGEDRRIDGMRFMFMTRMTGRPARPWDLAIVAVILHTPCLTLHDGLLAA